MGQLAACTVLYQEGCSDSCSDYLFQVLYICDINNPCCTKERWYTLLVPGGYGKHGFSHFFLM